MNAQDLDLLKKIADGKTLTQYDKTFIKQASEQYNLPFTPKGNCGSCYRDQAVIIYNAMKPAEQAQERKADGRKYHLPVGKQINFGGCILHDADLSDTLVELLIERGLSRDVFEVCE